MKKIVKSILYFALASTMVLTSCDDEDDDNNIIPDLTIPTTYLDSDYESNTTEQANLNAELKALSSAQKAANTGDAVTLASLTSAWDGTNLKNSTATDFQAIVDAELVVLANASNYDYDWGTAPTNEGGFFENRVFSPAGLECLQLVEKGLYGAAQFYQARQLVDLKGDNLTAADVDALVELFGASPAFSNSDKAAENPDSYAAKYAARRTKSSGGLYLNIKVAFIEARTYAAAGSNYDSQKATAVNTILTEWEKSIAATAINYMQSTVSKLSTTNPDNPTIEDGMHAYGEGVGFFTGLRALPASFRTFSDADGDAVLTDMLVPFSSYDSPADRTSYTLVQSPATSLPSIQSALDRLQTIYGFTDAEMDDFAFNWVNEEGR